MPSIFSRIISGEIPALKIAENDRFIAILDVTPWVLGHTLVIPKEEVNNLWDLDASMLEEYLVFAKPIAKAIEASFDCNRCAISVIGLEVPHAHMHLIPLNEVGEMNPKRERAQPTKEQMEDAQQRILAHLNKA